jgi:hypothetical protein
MRINKLILLGLGTLLVFVALGAFANVATSITHNEHMYIAASILVAQGKTLYKDFAYLQTPYVPLLYGHFYRLLNISSYYLLVAKGFSFLFLMASAAVVFFLSNRVLRAWITSFAIVLLFLLNMTLLTPAREVANYIMPLAFSLVGFYMLVVSIHRYQITPIGVALAGLCVAVSIGAKLTYVTTCVAFVATCLLYPTCVSVKTRLVRVLIPFVGGLAMGLAPMAYFALSGFGSFVFNNVTYHSVNAQWRHVTGYTRTMTLSDKLPYALSILLQPDNLILLLRSEEHTSELQSLS